MGKGVNKINGIMIGRSIRPTAVNRNFIGLCKDLKVAHGKRSIRQDQKEGEEKQLKLTRDMRNGKLGNGNNNFVRTGGSRNQK